MYLIWSGRVVIVKGDFQPPTILGYRGPGTVIGEMALLQDQPRSASVIALEHLRLLRTGRERFQEFLDSAPTVGTRITESLSARLRMSDTVRTTDTMTQKQLARQVSELQTEKQQLVELQHLRQETSDFIVHDLRNPLGIIHNAINLLEMVLPEDVLQTNQELLDVANLACGRMQRLVASLLDIARLEAGEVPLRLAVTNLNYLIEETISGGALAVKTGTGQVTLHSVIPPGLPAVVVDAEKINRVLTNLIDNAIQYTPRGGQVTVAAEVQADQVVVSVADTGPGVPPEERERIFERFAQIARDKQVRSRRGFGMGLAFCRLAVEAHGGRIWVEPGEEGVGSRFVFTLPLSRCDNGLGEKQT